MSTLELIIADLKDRRAELQEIRDGKLEMHCYGAAAELSGAISELNRLIQCYGQGFTPSTQELLK